MMDACRPTSSAERIAGRYIQAAFLSDKWFRSQKAALRDILKAPLTDAPRHWGYVIHTYVGPFFTKFLSEFKVIVSQDQAQESIQNRVEMAFSYLDALGTKLDKVGELAVKHVDFSDPASFLKWYAITECHEKMQAETKTVLDLFRYEWTLDETMLDGLVQKTLKVATPEDRASLTDDHLYGVKYKFLATVDFTKKALRALKKSKLDWDPTKWVDRIQEMLGANYSEQALQEQEAFREFDLFGMKVVIDDRTVDPGMTKKYVEYMIEAHRALKAKGFEKAWYGTIFIQCQSCGGVNTNTGGGTGGWYQIGKDTVSVFSRPSQFIVELIVHELGHRFWFKQMRPAQRAKFESLVKVHTVKRPGQITDVRPFKEQELKPFKRNIEDLQQKFERSLATGEPAMKLHGLAFDLVVAATMLEIDDDAKPETEPYREDLYDARFKTDKALDAFEDNPSEIAKVRLEFDGLVASALIYVDYAAQKHNELLEKKLTPEAKAWMDSYENNPNPVLPVSNYGKSNIDEAWAEMFAFYVLDFATLTRDQVESFRAVLKLSSADRVLKEFLRTQV